MPGVAFANEGATSLGATLPLWWVVPFALLLLSIALVSTLATHWWEPNKNKALVAVACGLPVLGWGLMNAPASIGNAAMDFTKFILLIGSLFVITGGVRLTGDLVATPKTNTLFLLFGAVLSNVLGTTGASLLLVRPFMDTNKERANTYHHLPFFIFLVSNVGGTLLPVGNPPLFMGFLRGVPFFWTLSLWEPWAVTGGLLLGVFYIWDSFAYAGETQKTIVKDVTEVQPLRLSGKGNLCILACVIGAIALLPSPWREVVMIGGAVLSLYYTPQSGEVRIANKFTFGPVVEVAILFSAIFVTLVPAIIILEARGAQIPLSAPWHFFWAGGLLSGFLDSAPAYLVTLAIGQAQNYSGVNPVIGVDPAVLTAISCGTSFMGLLSYLGNAPNLLVCALFQERGLKVPSFGAYILWAFAIAGPVFLLLSVLFFGLKLW